ncbi:hypothetical protein KIL84_001315 [Mauremys mutica]|uniref:Uncharacterized protein n=1 Tax=Mauremys mutica TaxID=74926 RepID=A0A9D3X0H9_9SAUR|nr:hypothetical protein KIL84_001315 [Mauremys mutica]
MQIQSVNGLPQQGNLEAVSIHHLLLGLHHANEPAFHQHWDCPSAEPQEKRKIQHIQLISESLKEGGKQATVFTCFAVSAGTAVVNMEQCQVYVTFMEGFWEEIILHLHGSYAKTEL